jgi:hypothetical protein
MFDSNHVENDFIYQTGWSTYYFHFALLTLFFYALSVVVFMVHVFYQRSLHILSLRTIYLESEVERRVVLFHGVSFVVH